MALRGTVYLALLGGLFSLSQERVIRRVVAGGGDAEGCKVWRWWSELACNAHNLSCSGRNKCRRRILVAIALRMRYAMHGVLSALYDDMTKCIVKGGREGVRTCGQ